MYVNTISDLQSSKAKLEARISALEDKDRNRMEKLQRMTSRADDIAKDAQQVAKVEQERSETLNKRYRHVMDKLRERDLEVERLRSRIQIDKTLDSLRR